MDNPILFIGKLGFQFEKINLWRFTTTILLVVPVGMGKICIAGMVEICGMVFEKVLV